MSKSFLYSAASYDQLTKHQKKQLKLLNEHGFHDDILNGFKLDIYNDDVTTVLKNYTNDTFCHQYLIYRKCNDSKQVTHRSGQNKQPVCQLQHAWTVFDLIHNKLDSKYDQNLNKALLYAQYLIYYNEQIVLSQTIDLKIVWKLKSKICMLYYHAASALLPNICIS